MVTVMGSAASPIADNNWACELPRVFVELRVQPHLKRRDHVDQFLKGWRRCHEHFAHCCVVCAKTFAQISVRYKAERA